MTTALFRQNLESNARDYVAGRVTLDAFLIRLHRIWADIATAGLTAEVSTSFKAQPFVL